MGLSCLTDPKATVVCDASTVINLNATGCPVAILKALPNPFVISEVALGELDEDTRSNRNDAKLVAEMQSLGLIKALPLDDGSSAYFERLVAGRTIDTLDDGEAATIAYNMSEDARLGALVRRMPRNSQIISNGEGCLCYQVMRDMVTHTGPDIVSILERELGNE